MSRGTREDLVSQGITSWPREIHSKHVSYIYTRQPCTNHCRKRLWLPSGEMTGFSIVDYQT